MGHRKFSTTARGRTRSEGASIRSGPRCGRPRTLRQGFSCPGNSRTMRLSTPTVSTTRSRRAHARFGSGSDRICRARFNSRFSSGTGSEPDRARRHLRHIPKLSAGFPNSRPATVPISPLHQAHTCITLGKWALFGLGGAIRNPYRGGVCRPQSADAAPVPLPSKRSVIR